MDKTKPNAALSGRHIAKEIVAKMKRHRRGKAAGIKDLVDGGATAEELYKEITAQQEMAGLDPAFAAYMVPQIQGVNHGGTDQGVEGDGAIRGYGLPSRRSVYAGRTADESADQFLLLMLGAFRCVRGSGQRNYRHYNS
jgi:hypothetical protein